MVVLVGYSVAGIRIVVLILSGRMWVVWAIVCRCKPSGDTWRVRQFVSGAQRERCCSESVLLGITGIVNCSLFVPRICTIAYIK